MPTTWRPPETPQVFPELSYGGRYIVDLPDLRLANPSHVVRCIFREKLNGERSGQPILFESLGSEVIYDANKLLLTIGRDTVDRDKLMARSAGPFEIGEVKKKFADGARVVKGKVVKGQLVAINEISIEGMNAECLARALELVSDAGK